MENGSEDTITLLGSTIEKKALLKTALVISVCALAWFMTRGNVPTTPANPAMTAEGTPTTTTAAIIPLPAVTVPESYLKAPDVGYTDTTPTYGISTTTYANPARGVKANGPEIDKAIENCKKLKSSEAYICFSTLADETKDERMCTYIVNKYHRETCMIQRAKKGDFRICEHFIGTPRYAECVFDITIQQDDMSYCNILPDRSPPHPQSMCKLTYILNKMQPKEECAGIAEEGIRAYCQAILSHNPKICEQLANADWGSGWSVGKCKKCTSYDNPLKMGCSLYISIDQKITPIA